MKEQNKNKVGNCRIRTAEVSCSNDGNDGVDSDVTDAGVRAL